MVGELPRESIGVTGKKSSDILKGLRILKEVLPPNSKSLPRTIYGGEFFHRKGIKKSEPIQKLIHFADCIHHGILPDGEVMAFMADALTEYLEGNKLTLDSAFALKAKPKKGNAIRISGIGRTKLYELINQGVIKTTTVGRRRLVIYSSLEELANAQ